MTLPLDDSATSGRQFIDLGRDIATTILRTIKSGWELALLSPDVNTDTGEIKLTERLRDGMRQVANEGKLPWHETMFVLSGIESRSRPDVLMPDGRIDIPILFFELRLCFGEHDPHAIIECKRIDGNDTYLCREYVVEGIDRFRKGKYSGNHSNGFMIGYLIAGDEQIAVTGINNNLNHRSRSTENLKPSHLVVESWVWSSLHPREGTSPIELHHSFLAFTVA